MPRGNPLVSRTTDMWIRLSNGEHITECASLRHRRLSTQSPHVSRNTRAPNRRTCELLVPNSDDEFGSVEWLTVRVTTKQIRDGRFAMDLLIRDVDGRLWL
ncbi:6282a121-5e3d-49d5-9b88-9c89dab541af-CDS [Sclerotinia trifoliorum]|uniref:6282a121-5e3d-49d5-9b88-9c89dab541af-CDS n=1 Tax=Sclerotinia trifoliorum TaxID=28548 RepID=A0A8H2ZLU0_9HELO|nr:6282a121-5e3d-49d5-9b88-9c89dab541af-CDS [Sclerotinia trifoliorum]